MLPFRFFRNGISQSLRSLVIPRLDILPLTSVHLRFRLGVNPATVQTSLASGRARFSTSRTGQNDTQYNISEPSTKVEIDQDRTTTSQALPGRLEAKLSLTFTCTVVQCGERSTHEFSKRAYSSGVVLVQCPKCKNRHLIADHLGWFKESTEDGKLRTVEDLVKAKGEKIRKGKLGFDGDVEYVE